MKILDAMNSVVILNCYVPLSTKVNCSDGPFFCLQSV